MRLNEYEDAIIHFGKAKKTNYPIGFIYYNTCRIYSLQQNKEQMLSTMEEGADLGITMHTLFLTDTAFNAFREDSTFIELLRKVELNAYPCLSNEDTRHFDFWLGEWEVFVNGTKVGENSINMAHGGCAVHENYTTSRNYAGQSINYFDPIDQKWHQHWVGSSGDVYNYIEVDRGDGMLQFQSNFKSPFNGQVSISRLTFTLNEDGTVRQLFESSTDGGETWTNAFDGLYKKKE